MRLGKGENTAEAGDGVERSGSGSRDSKGGSTQHGGHHGRERLEAAQAAMQRGMAEDSGQGVRLESRGHV